MIGVNSQIATSGAGTGNIGIGFAVPANTVRTVVPQLKTGHGVQHAYLGVATSPTASGNGAGSATSPRRLAARSAQAPRSAISSPRSTAR